MCILFVLSRGHTAMHNIHCLQNLGGGSIVFRGLRAQLGGSAEPLEEASALGEGHHGT